MRRRKNMLIQGSYMSDEKIGGNYFDDTDEKTVLYKLQTDWNDSRS